MGCTQSQHADVDASARAAYGQSNGNGALKQGPVQEPSAHRKDLSSHLGSARSSRTARHVDASELLASGEGPQGQAYANGAACLVNNHALQDQLLVHKASKQSSTSQGTNNASSAALRRCSSEGFNELETASAALLAVPLPELVAKLIAIVGSGTQTRNNGRRERMPEHKEDCEAFGTIVLSDGQSLSKEDQAIIFHLVRVKWTPFNGLDYSALQSFVQRPDAAVQPTIAARQPMSPQTSGPSVLHSPRLSPSGSSNPSARATPQHSHPQAFIPHMPELGLSKAGSYTSALSTNLTQIARSGGSGGLLQVGGSRNSAHGHAMGQPSPLSNRGSGGPADGQVGISAPVMPSLQPQKRQSGPGTPHSPTTTPLSMGSSRMAGPSASVAHYLARQNQHLQAKLQQQQQQRQPSINGAAAGAPNVVSTIRQSARMSPHISHLIPAAVASSGSSSGPGSPQLANPLGGASQPGGSRPGFLLGVAPGASSGAGGSGGLGGAGGGGSGGAGSGGPGQGNAYAWRVRSAWEVDRLQGQGVPAPKSQPMPSRGAVPHTIAARQAPASQLGRMLHSATGSGLSSPSASISGQIDSSGSVQEAMGGLSAGGGGHEPLKARGSGGIAGSPASHLGMGSGVQSGLQRSSSAAGEAAAAASDHVVILPMDLEGGPRMILEPRGAFKNLTPVQQRYLANLIRRRWTPFEEVATGRITYLQL